MAEWDFLNKEKQDNMDLDWSALNGNSNNSTSTTSNWGLDNKTVGADFDVNAFEGGDYGTKAEGGSFGSFFEKSDGQGGTTGGWGMDAFNIAKGAFQVYNSMQQLNLAEDALDFKKESFNKNYEAQRKITQESLDWRRKAREDRNPGSGGARTVI